MSLRNRLSWRVVALTATLVLTACGPSNPIRPTKAAQDRVTPLAPIGASTGVPAAVLPSPEPQTAIPTVSQTATPRLFLNQYQSLNPSLSASGRFVVFSTNNPVFLGKDAPACGTDPVRLCFQVVRYDALTGQVVVASANVDTAELADGDSQNGARAVSDDGHRVVFTSMARNFMDDPALTVPGVYLRDFAQGTLVRLDNAPTLTGGYAKDASLSNDGHSVAFTSSATLVDGEALPDASNIFLYDVETRAAIWVSQGSRRPEDSGVSIGPTLSPDGQWIAFWSWAGLIPEDDEPCEPAGNPPAACGDIYRYGVASGKLTRIALSEGLGEGTDVPLATITSGGRWIMAGDRLIDANNGQVSSIAERLGTTTCGTFLAPDGSYLVYFDSEQRILNAFELVSGKHSFPSDLSDRARVGVSTCALGMSPQRVLVAQSDLSAIYFASAYAYETQDRENCPDGSSQSNSCVDIYEWIPRNGQLTRVQP